MTYVLPRHNLWEDT
ncbi:mCG23399, isoform CRA_b [Mus musculus]|nr:mCG23399, isoform CRA_b [Mus musculus]